MNELALNHAFNVLSVRSLQIRSAFPFHQLSAQAAHHMAFTSDPDEIREKWAFAKNLPDFVRALALWASPALVEKHQELANDLFLKVCALPLSRASYDLQMSRMLTLLDSAIASAFKLGKRDLILHIKNLWASGYSDWLSIISRWEKTAESLDLALESDGIERAEFLMDKAFANSYCRQSL